MGLRRILIGATTAAAFIAGATAFAQQGTKTWTDPQNRATIDFPAAWPVDQRSKPGEPLVFLTVGPADAECEIFVQPRDSGDKPIRSVNRAYEAPIGPDKWVESLNGLQLYKRQAMVASSTVDASGPFPIQRADVTTDDGQPAFVAFQGRPGFEIWQACRSYDGKDRSEIFAAILKSTKSPRDAEWAAELAAAAATAAAPPPPPPEETKKKRR